MYTDFRSMLLESSIEKILKTEFKNIPFKMEENDDFIDLVIFVIPYKERRKGKGTEFMKRIIELGEQEGKDIRLTPDDGYLTDDEDMSLSDLKSFYKKLGFKEKKSGKFDYIYEVKEL